MEAPAKSGGLTGLRVLALESRRAAEMAKLIENYGGRAIVAPAMREVPLESNTEALEFARTLCSEGFDVVIFLTGVGARLLVKVAESIRLREQFVVGLRRAAIVARGPKPVAVLKELGVPVTLAVPEPNTWRDLLRALDEKRDALPLAGRRVAIQEYGSSNTELINGLQERGAVITRVPVYQWALPEDTAPLRNAVHAIASGEIDMALFTTSVQVSHLLRVAEEMNLESRLRQGFERVVVGSIGPITSEELREHGLSVDFEPEHPKMGFLVNEAAQRGAAIMEKKRGVRPSN
ncbi:MAG TPA: uroporphyrinogen-III synthase [Candidatus Acidoferrales bacterium]|nr:uroporphyrinogen-III synthase [Candidatus Acidoferrales bacterium]